MSTTHCLNCKSPLNGKFCSQCGQKADTSIPTLREIIVDTFNGLYSLDTRLWASLGALVLRPGYLTLAYIEGRRSSFTSPFKIYLIMSVVYFLLAALVSGEANLVSAIDSQENSTPNTQDVVDGCREKYSFLPGAQTGGLVSTFCGNFYSDQESFNSRFVELIPTMLIFSVPVLAAVMKLLYWRRHSRYVEHLVFLFHMNACLFFWLALGSLLGLLIHEDWLTLPLVAVILSMSGLYLHRVYQQSVLMTLLKCFLLLLVSIIILFAGFLLLIIYTGLTL